jgi:hypothetical protein
MTLDDLRAAAPDLGFALYAYAPANAGGPVTLEVHAAEGVFTFDGPTEAAVIAAAFPHQATEEPDVRPSPAPTDEAPAASEDIFA